MRIMKKLLIVGCGRSGTRYASKVLGLAGLDVGHEKDGRHGRVDWRCVHDPSARGRYDVVLHQVRHPLRVIESFHTAGKVSWRLVSKADPAIVGGPLLRDCARYWVRWNLAAEEMASMTYRVEDMGFVLPSIFESCGIDLRADWRSSLAVGTADHTRRGSRRHGRKIPSLTMAVLRESFPSEAQEVSELASRYGYDLS